MEQMGCYDKVNGIKLVKQMIAIASNLADFFKDKEDANEYRKTVDAFKYLARINLISDSFHNYSLFKQTFPESNYIAYELDPAAFSSKGKLRFNFVKYGISVPFIIMFKIKNLFHL